MTRIPFLGGLIVGVLVGALFSVWLVLPDERVAKNGYVFDASVEEVWAVFRDAESQAEWRPDIGRVEIIGTPERREWIEHPKRGPAIHFIEVGLDHYNFFSLEMHAENTFTGKYTAQFEEQDDNKTLGLFSETVRLHGLYPKIMSYLFVNQRDFTKTYCENAQAEIERRRDLKD